VCAVERHKLILSCNASERSSGYCSDFSAVWLTSSNETRFTFRPSGT